MSSIESGSVVDSALACHLEVMSSIPNRRELSSDLMRALGSTQPQMSTRVTLEVKAACVMLNTSLEECVVGL
jgi:hypothetical protein